MAWQKVAAAILIVLGVGHLAIVAAMQGALMAQWFGEGMWAAVPLISERSVETLRNDVAFWSGIGSFAIPSILLGGMIWEHARNSNAVPIWMALGVIVWFGMISVLLVPSPGIAGVAAGIMLLVVAMRQRNVGSGKPDS